MEFRQMTAHLFPISHALERISIVHSVHDFLDIGISLISKIALKLLAFHSWSEVHDCLRGLPLVDFRGRRLAD